MQDIYLSFIRTTTTVVFTSPWVGMKDGMIALSHTCHLIFQADCVDVRETLFFKCARLFHIFSVFPAKQQ